MSDLIEKQAVIDALLAKMDTIDDKPEVVLGLAVAAGMIKGMPSALEQEPCTDAISRQAVLEAIRKCHCEEWIKADIGAPIEALPSVTPVEKVGHWIKERTYMECPKCHDIWHYEENQTERFKCCPNCGAKMQASPAGAEGSEE